MGTIVAILLIVIAIALFWAVKVDVIDNDTLSTLANVAGVVALLAAIAVFIVPTESAKKVPSTSIFETSSTASKTIATSTPEHVSIPTLLSEPTRDPTATPIPATRTPVPPTTTPTFSPIPPTGTPIPIPTSTSTRTPLPTKTPRPTATSTLIGAANEVHQISGESTGVKNGSTYGASEKSWYSTNVFIKAGDQVSIKYLSGEWWVGKLMQVEGGYAFAPQTSTDAGGYVGREEERVIAQMMADNPYYCEELPSAPIGSLIGRIGTTGGIFAVGNSLDFTAQEEGILFLRMNYNTRIGFAFNSAGDCPKENGGYISVRVIVIPSS